MNESSSSTSSPSSREQPSLETTRLSLRPFGLKDAKRVQQLAGDRRVAATTASIPHPYQEGAAEEWISTHDDAFTNAASPTFAITLKSSGELVGCINLFGTSSAHAKSEVGYWIGVEYWNQGYATEAARCLFAYGFEQLKLNKITSRHLAINPSSGRVMQKAGMTAEGILREEFCKAGVFHDIAVYGLLKSEFKNR